MMNCPVCGSDSVETAVSGSSLIGECKDCGWTLATTYTSPIERDQTRYSLFLAQGNPVNRVSLSVISRIASCGFISARAKLEDCAEPIMVGSALDVRDAARSLRGADVMFTIQPEFPYEL